MASMLTILRSLNQVRAIIPCKIHISRYRVHFHPVAPSKELQPPVRFPGIQKPHFNAARLLLELNLKSTKNRRKGSWICCARELQ